MQTLIETLVCEKRSIGPCGASEVRQVALCLWIVVDYLITYLAS